MPRRLRAPAPPTRRYRARSRADAAPLRLASRLVMVLAAGITLTLLAMGGWPRPALAQAALPPAGAGASVTSSPTSSVTSSIVPSLGTAAAPAPADAGTSTVETLEPSATNRPLTSSEQRFEWLDKVAIAGFVVVSLIVVLVRQRRSPLTRGRRGAGDDFEDELEDAADHDPRADRRAGLDDDVLIDLRFDDHPRVHDGDH